MILRDTDVLINCIRKRPAAMTWVKSIANDELVVPGSVAMELVAGCRTQNDLRAAGERLRPIRRVWPAATHCEQALQSFGNRRLAFGLGLIDALIAQTAIVLDAPLYIFNRKYFDVVPRLKTIQPYAR